MRHRLAQFAKDSQKGRLGGALRPSVELHGGSFLPNSANPKEDKGYAKIANCSDTSTSWGKMNGQNMTTVKSKLNSGQICRNIVGRKDAARAAEERKKGKAAGTAFCTNQQVGAQVSIWKPKKADFPEDYDRPTSSAAGPAQPTQPPASFSSADAAAPRKVAPAVPKANILEPAFFASGLGRSPAPKAAQAPPPTTTRGRIPKARTEPATPIVLHTYSLGLASLMDGNQLGWFLEKRLINLQTDRREV